MKTINSRYAWSSVCRAALLAASLSWCAGCGKKAAPPQTYDTDVSEEVMAFIQKYQPAQEIARIDIEGRFASLQELVARDLIKDDFAGAIDSQESPSPFKGYIVTDIDKNEAGDSLDRRRRSGICAYPAPPGKLAAPIEKKKPPVILVLMDTEDPEDCAVYVAAPRANLPVPVRQWPSAAVLDDNFKRLEKKISNKLDDAKLNADEKDLPSL